MIFLRVEGYSGYSQIRYWLKQLLFSPSPSILHLEVGSTAEIKRGKVQIMSHFESRCLGGSGCAWEIRKQQAKAIMDATMGSIAPTGLKGKLAALEESFDRFDAQKGLMELLLFWSQDFISMQNEELAAQRQDTMQKHQQETLPT